MTATTIERMTRGAGVIPTRGTFPMAAAVLFPKGTILTHDGTNADVPTANQDAIGVASASFDNRDGSAGDLLCELEYGVFGFAVSGTPPVGKGEPMFVVDNQTVSLDSSSGTRGVAGFCSEYRDGQAYIWMGPHVSATYADVAAVESVADDADAKANDLAVIEIPVPITAFRLATGAAAAAWTDGSVDGYNLADSEAFGIRHNPSSSTVFWTGIKLPEDLDTGAAVEIHFLVARIGAADTTAALTVTAFRNRDAAAYDAGADLSAGATGAISGATKVVHDVSVALTGAAAGDNISFSFVPTAALDADDSLVMGCYIKCTRDVG